MYRRNCHNNNQMYFTIDVVVVEMSAEVDALPT